MGSTASTTRSALAGWLPSRRRTRRRKDPIVLVFRTHTCHTSMDSFLAVKSDHTNNTLRRHRATAIETYLACTLASHDAAIMERSLDLLLTCPACMSELCTLTAAKSEALFRLVLFSFYTPPSAPLHVPYTITFEAVLKRATKAYLPCFYGGTCGLVDFPCVSLGLCGCILRPLYTAIYYSNLELLKLLLRYGAEVQPRDACRCGDRYMMHPLIRVYESLSTTRRHPALLAKDDAHPGDFVRCHQLAMLVMPADLVVLSETCVNFARLVTPADECETLLRAKGSLQHLCRLRLRAWLSRLRAMPAAVERLPLPRKLQRYILYESFEECL
ncbi:hypothetical protein HPB49_025103 [Dermacentor silvarum]|uniref:Uncharacterized protein n=1 Tax=Dermacentor silvarum TaxID=543639 RepID=A0ACB8CCG8_DERSI|nr:hypothetical protein HPB49_025103 [Dermacentor silvarum]